MAVGQVAAVRQVHAEDGVARLERGQQHRHVGLGAGMWLHVGVFGAEERLGALDRQRLDHVHVFTAAVVALARVPFRVLVREHRAGGLEHGHADEVFGGDELEPRLLPRFFVGDGGGHLGIGAGERAVEETSFDGIAHELGTRWKALGGRCRAG